MITTAEDSFNIFRPNLDPDFEETTTQQEESKTSGDQIKQTDYTHDTEEDTEAEEKRMVDAAKELNRQRQVRSASKGKINKRIKTDDKK